MLRFYDSVILWSTQGNAGAEVMVLLKQSSTAQGRAVQGGEPRDEAGL